MESHIAHIAADEEITRHRISHIAWRRPALDPVADHQPQQTQLKEDEHAHLRHHHEIHGAPGIHCLERPVVRERGEPPVLAGFRAEGLHHRIAGDGVGNCAAHRGIRSHTQSVSWGHETPQQQDRDHNIGHRTRKHIKPHQRPMKHEARRHPDHDERGRQEPHEQRVGQRIIGPHAARDLAHGGACEITRMPVRAVALHAMERLIDDAAHNTGRQHAPADHGTAPRNLEADGLPDKKRKRDPCRAGFRQGGRVTGAGDSFDQPSRHDGEEHIEHDRGQHQAQRYKPDQREPAPIGPEEACDPYGPDAFAAVEGLI